jgi:hypothetical protein
MSENLKKMVDEVRKDLTAVWDQCYVSKKQRAAFRIHLTGYLATHGASWFAFINCLWTVTVVVAKCKMLLQSF